METLTAQVFRTMARASASRLEAEKARVDALNVFPVPDGDTGTNMALTLWAAVDAVLKSPSNSLGELAKAAADGALMGARGNSGVILSQFLRGFAEGLQGLEEANAQQLAQAFVKAAEAAYGAVIRPVEGTVLTVGKEAAKEALRLAQDEGRDLVEVLEGALMVAMGTLARTPELLDSLRDAGVVDAGGEGLVVAAQGAFDVLNGKETPLADSTPIDTPQPVPSASPPSDLPSAVTPASIPPIENIETKRQGITEAEDINFKYCTEFLVRGSALNIADIQQALADLGDSMLVVGQPDLVKVHIHTNHPGLVLEICGSRGYLSAIHINNMEEQNKAAAAAQGGSAAPAAQATAVPAPAAPAPSPPAVPAAPAALAVVAVASGDGCVELLKSLGVTEVVRGGQTMNPSTEQLLNAVKATGARSAIILPNNGNVLMTARQASHLASIPITVVPTRDFCEGIAAMLQYSPMDTAADNAKRMEEAIGDVATGEVTIAVRDARVDGRDIKAGQHMGISHSKILALGSDRKQVLIDLVDQLRTSASSLVTLYYGEQVPEEEVTELKQVLSSQFEIEVEAYNGGQPVYSYLVSVE